MGTRTVRLDDETKKVLREIQTASDMPDLGPGGYAKGPSTKTRAIATRAIRERSRP